MISLQLFLSDKEKQRGILYLAGACLIWAGWWVINRHGVVGGMLPADIMAIRFSVAGLLLLPVIIKMGLGTSWQKALVIGFTGGLINSFGAIAGVVYAPASHGATLMPGLAPIFTGLLAWLILNEGVSKLRWIGIVLLLFGAVMMGAQDFLSADGTQWIGHLFFIGASLSWSAYIVCLKLWRINPWRGAAIIAVVSMIIYLPVYSFIFGARALDYPVQDIIVQGAYQGILTSIGAFALFNMAVGIFGAAGSGAANAIIPVLTVIIAAAFLGEYPNIYEALGILVIICGLPFAMGLMEDKKTKEAETPILGTKLDTSA